MPKDNEPPVEVIQGDEQAAARFALSLVDDLVDKPDFTIINEPQRLAQAFARHRLAYQSEAPAQGEGIAVDVERVRLLLGDLLFKFDPSCGGNDCDYTARMVAPKLVAALSPAPSLPLADREAIARGDADIVLVSQDRVNPLGYQLHGLFYSFADAARHVAKDAQLTAEQETALIEGWGGLSDRYESAEVGVWWVAARQPTRSPAILALSGSLPPSPVGEGSK